MKCNEAFERFRKKCGGTRSAQEVWNAAWNMAIESALLQVPAGNYCDPQEVADEIRTLKENYEH